MDWQMARPWNALILTPLLMVSSAAAIGQAPVMPFEDRGACPLEQCTYGSWTAKADIVAYQEPTDRSPIAFNIRRGESVTALTGVVVISKPGRARIDSPSLTARAGDTVYLLTPHGEGEFKAWNNGNVFVVDTSQFKHPDTRGAGYSSCQERNTCRGEVLAYPKHIWRVQLRNRDGKTGWTTQALRFSQGQSP